MGLLDAFINKNKYNNRPEPVAEGDEYEFCPRCEANLTLQKGYSNELPFWNCRGCGEMLINPNVEAEDDIAWFCDGCECMLNTQEGFSQDCGSWKCSECGFINKIDVSELYLSDDEYQQSLLDPYKGLTDEAVLELSMYEDIESINQRSDIILVKNMDDDKLYVKKFLKDYDLSVYEYLRDNPIEFMPRLIGVYEGSNNLVIIEEYIEGPTIQEALDNGCFTKAQAIDIAIKVCRILCELHGMTPPIIHRDIKPSNIILANDNSVYLLDINVAKWYKPEENEDTRMFGTLYYAAPEQLGYGFTASSEKSDIYAVGVLLNVLLTGKIPKEEKAPGAMWPIIEQCISMESDKRYTAAELITVLERIKADD